MIKKLLFASAFILAPALAQAFVPVRYVQISTNSIPLQAGGFNTSSGTVQSFTVVSSETVKTLGVTGSINVPLTVASSETIRGNLGVMGQVDQPLTVTSSVTINNAVRMGSNGNNVIVSSNTLLPGVTFYSGSDPLYSSTITFSPTTLGIRGTTTNDTANEPLVGYYASSTSASNQNFPTTNQYGDLVSITLTAGDWDVSFVANATANSATVTAVTFGVGTATGNNNAGLTVGDTRMDILPPVATSDNGTSLTMRKSISGSTTYYLKYLATYSVATPRAFGRISARRAH